MKLRHSIFLAALVVSTAAFPHTALVGSLPTDKSRVRAPAAIELHFSEAARVTALTMQKGKDAAVDIKPLPAKAAKDVSVPAPALTAGDYVVNWRAASDDGHVVSGKFGFTVDPAAPAQQKPAAVADQHKH